ncbi:MAG TPA: glycosyltransferase family 39 protein [Abditibacteriaceae bacterium]|jgi:hypothetical protein
MIEATFESSQETPRTPSLMQAEITDVAHPHITSSRFFDTRYKVVYALIFLLASYLALVRLDNTAFWDDEAHISIMARNFLHTGTWTGWDGRNLLGYGNGSVLEPNLRHIIPQLDAPVIATAFGLFGETTWAGRFLFVVAGLLSLALFAALLRREFAQQRALQIFAFASLAFSVHFLMAIRSCRYYAIAILFALLVFGTYRRCLQQKRVLDFVLLGLWAILLFLSSCLVAAAFLGALVVVHLVFHRRDWRARDWSKAALAIAVFLCGAVPYAVINRIWDFPIPNTQPWYERKMWLLVSNVSGLNWVGLPWVVALGVVFFVLPRPGIFGKKEDEETSTREQASVVFTVREWGMLVLGYAFFIAMLSPLEINQPNDDALRYLYPVLPWMAGLCGAFLWFVRQHMKLLAPALFLVIIGSNLLSLSPRSAVPRFLLTDYIAEVHQPYPTAYGEVVKFLRRHAQHDDSVYVVPQHMNYPLMFYVGDHVRFAGQINRKTHLSLDTIRALPAPLIFEENFPDWFVSFGTWPGTPRTLRFFSRPHTQSGKRIAYSYRLFTTLDVFYEQTHRPEIPWHSFGSHRNFDRTRNAVYIYRRSAPRVLNASAR